MRRLSTIIRGLLLIGAVTVVATPAFAADLIQVPVRWCWMEGSPTAQKWLEGQNPERILFRRTERANGVWRPQADIEFFSPLSISVGPFQGVPILDPAPPPDGPGKLGDVQTIDATAKTTQEVLEAFARCEQSWENLEDLVDWNISGITVVNMGWAVNSFGTVGLAAVKDKCAFGSWPDVCADPTRLAENSGVTIIVIDEECYTGSTYCFPQFTVGQDETEHVLPHELGHALWLGHGNGLDDNGDGRIDSCCDGTENDSSNDNLMTAGTQTGTLLTAEQVERARAIARVTPGARFLTPTGFVAGDVIADQVLDPMHDVSSAAVDLVALDTSLNRVRGALSVSHRLMGTVPPSGDYRFVAFLDLDGDAATGGAPADLGFDTAFFGADWVTQVEIVETTAPDQELRVTAWEYTGSAFVPRTPDPRIIPVINRQGELETDTVSFERIGVELPLDALGVVAERVIVQAFAEDVGGATRDLLPDAGGTAGDLVRLVAPRVQGCAATPSPVRPAAELTVGASGLLPLAQVAIDFDGEAAASTTSDGQGEASATFPVPFDQPQGVANVGVSSRAGSGSSLAVGCSVEVAGPALVEIDVKPGSDLNPIQINAKGVIPVAILGSELLDVADIDASTLAFGPAAAAPALRSGPHIEDVNTDGVNDLVAHFQVQGTGIEVEQEEACLTGETLAGTPFEGCDSIRPFVGGMCGLGVELALLVPPLLWLHGRRRRGTAA